MMAEMIRRTGGRREKGNVVLLWKFESIPAVSGSMCPKDLSVGLISDSFHLDREEGGREGGREGGKGLSCLMEEAAAAAASIYSVNQDECVCTTYEVLNGPPLRGEEEISRETSKETLSG